MKRIRPGVCAAAPGRLLLITGKKQAAGCVVWVAALQKIELPPATVPLATAHPQLFPKRLSKALQGNANRTDNERSSKVKFHY